MKTRGKPSTRWKRTDNQREFDLCEVARWLSEGMMQQEILPRLNASRPYTISRTQLVYDVATIRKRWREESVEKIDELIAEEIAIIRQTRRKAFVAWEQSCKPRPVKSKAAPGVKRNRIPAPQPQQEATQCGDPAFLNVVIKCNERICSMRNIGSRLTIVGDESAPVTLDATQDFQAVFGMTMEQADERLREQIAHEVRQQINAKG